MAARTFPGARAGCLPPTTTRPSKICFGHERGGIALPNGLGLMEHYVHAIRKVLVDNLEAVADLAGERPD